MMDAQEIETAQEENVRFVEVGKNKLYMRRTDPFGYIHFQFERGELPKELQGSYTSFAEARKKVDAYLGRRAKIEEIKETRAAERTEALGLTPDPKPEAVLTNDRT